ncbi:MAG TPA: hypothetical protein VNM92_09115 [Thermoanaerobaculia bacterium]|nr:hypothetical protein [Thermoanaerobaculia bacterium]
MSDFSEAMFFFDPSLRLFTALLTAGFRAIDATVFLIAFFKPAAALPVFTAAFWRFFETAFFAEATFLDEISFFAETSFLEEATPLAGFLAGADFPPFFLPFTAGI